jgi:hypothetical protein
MECMDLKWSNYGVRGLVLLILIECMGPFAKMLGMPIGQG